MASNEETKKDTQAQEQIFYNFVQILQTFPQYTIAQHIVHIMRRKGDIDPYFWTNENLLKKFEKYYDELNNDLLISKEEEKVEEDY